MRETADDFLHRRGKEQVYLESRKRVETTRGQRDRCRPGLQVYTGAGKVDRQRDEIQPPREQAQEIESFGREGWVTEDVDEKFIGEVGNTRGSHVVEEGKVLAAAYSLCTAEGQFFDI